MVKKVMCARALLGLCAAIAAVAPVCIQAADETVLVSRQVSYAGIDVNTSEGAGMLYVRLKQAASRLCSATNEEYRGPSWRYRECIQQALAKVMLDAKRPLLTQKFVSDYGNDAAAKFGVDSGVHVAKQ